MPRRATERRRDLANLRAFPHTLIAFEAPHRLNDALTDIAAVLGPGRRVVVAREITKLHEEIVRRAGEVEGARFAEKRRPEARSRW